MREHELDLNDFILDEIESIELIGEEDTIDITVDDTHMFYANGIYTHNSAITSEIVDTHHMGGSIKKAQIGHFIMSIARTIDQKDTKKANVAILKSRFGRDGVIFTDVLFDNSKVDINLSENSFGHTRTEHKKNVEVKGQQRTNEVLDAMLNRNTTLNSDLIEKNK